MSERPEIGEEKPAARPIGAAELALCTEILEAIVADDDKLNILSKEERIRFLMAAGRVLHPEAQVIRRRIKNNRSALRREKSDKDRALRASTAIRTARLDAVFVPAPKLLGSSCQNVAETKALSVSPDLQTPRACYVCKAEFTTVHFFYDSMCPKCASFNYEKRFQTASLKGKVAIITGGRLKIGYQSALMMLRAGARVIVTTRFPQDSALRFIREPDFAEWKERVQVHGLDLRHSPSVEAFCREMDQTLPRLDILINNAAQTVRRPPGFYKHMMELEAKPVHELPLEAQYILRGHESLKNVVAGPGDTRWVTEWHSSAASVAPGITSSAALSQIPYHCDDAATDEHFPVGKLDADLQQVDHRKTNSWRMTLAEVPTAELLEVQLVNSIAPFILCSKLKPLMLRDRTDEKHIVNVSAMEGKFSRHTKTDKHPHTNMAKAALNMMTLTSARDYAKDGIFMNAVDTGWVTDEDPAELSKRKEVNHDFQPPLDIVDGAARVCDPFFSGILSGKHSWGNFLKDYFPTPW
jgi:NAD(P)-dependent dehydrogenase (short-subunit alcohol dehydrogenase family)